VKGPKGTRSFTATDDVTIAVEDNVISVSRAARRSARASSGGMSRSMVANLVTRASPGLQAELEITGVGYRAQMQGKDLKLSLGYSHDVNFPMPEGVTITTPKPTEIVVEGIDQQLVGQVAANIREWRPPEPYKGKGIRYKGEFIFRKEGKKK
jgi:large subunit ribosomal protein L6